jgi:DNA-binding NarL/FixJ family response regulator
MTSVDDRLARLRTLSSREQEVLILLNQGYLNKEIAQTLGIATRTVSFHNVNIYLKLGIGEGLPSSVRRLALGKFCNLKTLRRCLRSYLKNPPRSR